MEPLAPIRRIVTVEGAEGGLIVDDAVVAPGRVVVAGVRSTHLWATAAAPAPLDAADDGAGSLAGSAPAPRGGRLGMLDISPGAAAGPMHRTDTIDYVICLAGEIELVLGESVARLRPGDVVVQCGASHTWRNTGAQPARLAFMMTDAEPKRAGSLGRSERVEGARSR